MAPAGGNRSSSGRQRPPELVDLVEPVIRDSDSIPTVTLPTSDKAKTLVPERRTQVS